MICFAWSGFPQYAARCVGAFVRATSEKVVVVATKPKVPIEGMESVCGCPVFWVSGDDRRTLKELIGEEPRALLVSSWIIPAFNRYRDEVRKIGGKVFCLCDHNHNRSWIDWLRAIRFRLFLKNKYDGFMVPGKSGVECLQFYGVSSEMIRTGMYSADASVFTSGKPIDIRPKKIIYVGQFIERKNVRRMVIAFKNALRSVGGDWTLELYGSGPLRKELSSLADSHVAVKDFVQPENLSALYRDAQWFCLPSIEEHWGLVVHEAALSGCGLLLSNKVGAADDLLTLENGFTFNPNDINQMTSVFIQAMKMDSTALKNAQNVSLRLAREINLDSFVKNVVSLVRDKS